MRQVTRKGLITVAAAAGGLLALSSGGAFADSNADGSAVGSPGVASGNSVQAPVDAPVNLCGNTVNVVGVLNPAFGNNCANVGDGNGDKGGSGARAEGHASGSPGLASGNSVQAPIEVPVNACGNSLSVVGLGNSSMGNGCVNGDAEQPAAPESPAQPADTLPAPVEEADEEPAETGVTEEADEAAEAVAAPEAAELAATGGDLPLGAALPVGAGLLIGGYVLYRRGRVAPRG
jgi:hypothetical protein